MAFHLNMRAVTEKDYQELVAAMERLEGNAPREVQVPVEHDPKATYLGTDAAPKGAEKSLEEHSRQLIVSAVSALENATSVLAALMRGFYATGFAQDLEHPVVGYSTREERVAEGDDSE